MSAPFQNDGVTDGRDRLALLGGQRREQRARSAEQQAAQLATLHTGKQRPAQNGGAASAAGAAAVHVLPLRIEDHHAAVLHVCVDAVLLEKSVQNFAAEPPPPPSRTAPAPVTVHCDVGVRCPP